MKSPPDIAALARLIRSGDRATLARAITLIESKRADHRKKAHQLVQDLLPFTGNAICVGITGRASPDRAMARTPPVRGCGRQLGGKRKTFAHSEGYRL